MSRFEPLGGPLPLPVDAVRDAWDWVVIGGGIASVIAAAVAIYLAVKANGTAQRAMDEATNAEGRAIVRAAAERRALFELEILRDLLEQLDAHEWNLADRFAEQPDWYFRQHLESRLAMLPDNDLRFWRNFPRLTPDERWSLFSEIPNGDIRLARNRAALRSEPWSAPRGFDVLFRERLRADVLLSVERRMDILDAPLPSSASAEPR